MKKFQDFVFKQIIGPDSGEDINSILAVQYFALVKATRYYDLPLGKKHKVQFLGSVVASAEAISHLYGKSAFDCVQMVRSSLEKGVDFAEMGESDLRYLLSDAVLDLCIVCGDRIMEQGAEDDADKVELAAALCVVIVEELSKINRTSLNGVMNRFEEDYADHYRKMGGSNVH